MSIISKIDLHSQGDPFEVTVGGSDNPGSLQVKTLIHILLSPLMMRVSTLVR